MKIKSVLKAGAFVVFFTSISGFAGTFNDYIVGGQDVSAGDAIAKSTVIVTDGNFICTGSIIDTDTVVTAAHCVDAKPEDMKIVFSRSLPDPISGAEVHSIYGFQANPEWKGEASKGVDQHDIAVIRFKGKLPAGYEPAEVLGTATSLVKGATVTLAGYGITDADSHDGAGTLRKVDVEISKKLGKTEIVLDQTSGKGACHGDSGGPAFLEEGGKLMLWGVTNRGYPSTAPDDCVHYAVYTKISAYADFIATAEADLRK